MLWSLAHFNLAARIALVRSGFLRGLRAANPAANRQGDHSPGKYGKPGIVRENESGQGKVRENEKSQGKVREKLNFKRNAAISILNLVHC